jgi:hypothetical protein
MNVDATAARNVEHGLRQQQTVSGNDEQIRLQHGKLGNSGRFPQRCRLPDADTFLLCENLDRTRSDFLAAAGRAVRLCQHEVQHKASGNQCRK